jgi:hypothetical protein
MNKLQAAILVLIWVGQFRLAAQSTSAGYYSEFGEPAVWASGGAPVPDNNMVCIGYFDPGFDVMANADDLDALLGAWHQFDATTISLGAGAGEAGHFADSGSLTTAQGGALFVDQQIWLWAFKTSDNTAPNPDYADVTQYGLYSNTAANWKFKPMGSYPANNTDIRTSDPGLFAAFGSISGGHLNLAQVVPVPEPAIGGMLLVGLGVFGVIAKRRVR